MRSMMLGSVGALLLSAAPALAEVITFNCASGNSCSVTSEIDDDVINHLSCEWSSSHVNRIELAATSNEVPQIYAKHHVVLSSDERGARAVSRMIEQNYYNGTLVGMGVNNLRLTLYATKNGSISGTCYTR